MAWPSFSAAHAQAALDAGQQITAVFNLDSMGYASTEPNSQVVPDGFELLFPAEYAELEASEFRGDFLRRSDHASFWSLDIPALWLNDTGEFRYPSYHCGEGDDIVEQVDLEFALQITKVTLATTGSALGL